MGGIRIQDVVALIVVGLIFAYVSNLSYNDEVAQDQYYCAMTQAGNWPKYRNVECE